MNQKGDAAAGQADGKNTVLGLKERLDFTQILFVIPQIDKSMNDFHFYTKNKRVVHLIISIYYSDFVKSFCVAKRKMWKLKSFGSLRNVSKTGIEICLCITAGIGELLDKQSCVEMIFF